MNNRLNVAVAINSVLAVSIPLLLCVSNPAGLRAQPGTAQEFEVVSVKHADIAATAAGVPVFPVRGGIGASDPQHITWQGTWLTPLMADAFGVRTDQITGPAWLTKERYDIAANIPAGATKAQFNIMLGNLLRDPFHLRFHMESKSRPVYALRVAKNGPKFSETAVRPTPRVFQS